jgi:hypothetical protein
MRTLWLTACLFLMAASLRAGDAEDQAALRALIGRAIKASGGEAQVARLHAVRWKTKLRAPGIDKVMYSDSTVAQGLDQYRAELEVDENGKIGLATFVVNKKEAWMKIRDKVLDAGGPFLAVRRNAYQILRLPELLLPVRDPSCKLAPLGEVKIAGKDAVGVRVVRKGHADLNVYFDKDTGLLAKCESRFRAANSQEYLVEYQVGDYKEFDGVKHFTRVTFLLDGTALGEIELSDIEPQGKVDDAVFAKP